MKKFGKLIMLLSVSLLIMTAGMVATAEEEGGFNIVDKTSGADEYDYTDDYSDDILDGYTDEYADTSEEEYVENYADDGAENDIFSTTNVSTPEPTPFITVEESDPNSDRTFTDSTIGTQHESEHANATGYTMWILVLVSIVFIVFYSIYNVIRTKIEEKNRVVQPKLIITSGYRNNKYR
ncbi:MAG: hypothetical protein Q4C42_02445 [Clostridia bacterium]|nr:hypothetical protein [Clostridia bacterium]